MYFAAANAASSISLSPDARDSGFSSSSDDSFDSSEGSSKVSVSLSIGDSGCMVSCSAAEKVVVCGQSAFNFFPKIQFILITLWSRVLNLESDTGTSSIDHDELQKHSTITIAGPRYTITRNKTKPDPSPRDFEDCHWDKKYR